MTYSSSQLAEPERFFSLSKLQYNSIYCTNFIVNLLINIKILWSFHRRAWVAAWASRAVAPPQLRLINKKILNIVYLVVLSSKVF